MVLDVKFRGTLLLFSRTVAMVKMWRQWLRWWFPITREQQHMVILLSFVRTWWASSVWGVRTQWQSQREQEIKLGGFTFIFHSKRDKYLSNFECVCQLMPWGCALKLKMELMIGLHRSSGNSLKYSQISYMQFHLDKWRCLLKLRVSEPRRLQLQGPAQVLIFKSLVMFPQLT